MFTARVQASQLAERLDAEYFTPDFVAADSRILKAASRFGDLKTLEQLREPSTGLCYGVLQPRFVDDGVPAIEIADLTTGILSDSGLRISREQHREYHRSAVIGGDVLISVKGTLGTTAVAPAGIEERNVNRDIARLRVRETDIDPYYLVTYLQSRDGGLALQRIVRGTIQRNLNIGDLLEHLVLAPATKAQRYIGDKLRQAERLRGRAREQRCALVALLAVDGFAEAAASPDSRFNRVTAAEMRPRLDAKYYGDRVMAVQRAAAINSQPLEALVDEVSNGFEHRDFVDEGTAYITVSEVSSGRLVVNGAPCIPSHATVPDKARIDSRCALVVRTGSIGIAVKVFAEDAAACISSHLIRLRCPSEMAAALVVAFLNSEAGVILQNKISYGAVQPQIGQDELLALPVPRVLVDRAEPILRALELEDAALREADRLTLASKRLVEALIEGTLSEAELIAAQDAGESRDSSLDRAILGSLRRDEGNSAQLLFPNVDALFNVLRTDADGVRGQ